MADPAQFSYNTLRKKYGGWKSSNFEDTIKKATRPSELDELRIAIKYFLSKEEAIRLQDVISDRLNQLSDKLISFGDFMYAYKSPEAGFKEMRDRCVKRGNDWVCASYMTQVEYYINRQTHNNTRAQRVPVNEVLSLVEEGHQLIKIIEEKWKEIGDTEKNIPGYIELEIKDLFKGLLAKQIGIDRFWVAMDIRSEVEGKPIITPAKKMELIDLWAKHGILLPAEKHIVKPEITMPKPPAAPMEPIPTEELRQVIKKQVDIQKRIEELRKKKELERQREKERQEGKLPVTVTRPPVPTPPAPAVPSPELDLMKDEIERRIAEIMKRKGGEGQAGEPAARYGIKKKELILQVTGTESRYSGSGSQWIKTPVSVSIEKDQNAHYLLYRRGSGKEISTSYHTKTYDPIYIERYQGPFGYTIEIRFTNERNSVIKTIFDPDPNPKFINGVILEDEHRIAVFDVDESSFRKAEQFARENNVIKESGEGLYQVNEKFPESPEGIGDDTPPQEDIKSWAVWAEIVDFIKKHGLKKWMDTEYAAHLEGMTAEELKLLRKIIEGTDDLTASERLKIQEKIEQRLKPPMRDKDISKMSYAELHFLISTEQDTDELKRLYSLVDTLSNMTDFDKELLKEEIVQRMQRILEAEESAKPGGPNEGFAEGAAGYDKKDKTIRFFHGTNLELKGLQAGSYITKSFKDACKFGYRKSVMSNSPYVYIYEIKCSKLKPDPKRDRAFISDENCPAILINKYKTYDTPYKLERFTIKDPEKIEGAADINLKLLHRKEIAHLSKDIEDKCIPLGYINIYSLYPKARFGTDTAIIYDCRNTDSSKLKRDTIVKGENDIIIATSSKLYLKRYHPNLTEIMLGAGGGSVAESTASYDITNIEDIKKIKLAALSGVKKIWIVNKGREGLILSAKYGKEWWEKASEEDVERITVYEPGGEYELSAEEYTKASKLTFDELLSHNICPECMHKMVNGKCLLHGTRDQILSYYSKSNIFKLKHSPDMIIAGAINKGWRRWTGEASYEIRDLSKTNADFINMRLKQHFDNSGLHDAHIDVWSEGKYYNFDKSVWDKSNHDILQVIKKITPKSYQPAKAMELKLMENEYLIRDPATIGDPDAWIVSKGAAFLDDIRGAHHGQVDGTLIAYNIKTRETIGYIDYSLFEGKLYLNSIEVEPSHRRHGYATALMLKLKKLNPGMPVKWGMMTEEGCALKSGIDRGIAEPIAGGDTVVRELAENLFKDEKKDCKDWTFGDYEILLSEMKSPDDLEEMLDCVILSNKLTNIEIETLRKLIEKKMEE